MFFIIRLFAVIIIAYQFLILARILISWFGRLVPSRYMEIINKLTDPYLALFKNIKFSKTSTLDFSAIIGLVILSIISGSLMQMANMRALSLRIFLGITISTVGGTIGMLAIIAGVLALLRFLSLTVMKRTKSPAWQILDMLLNPLQIIVMKIIRRQWEYPQLLIALVLMLALFLIAGFILLQIILFGILLIPF